MSARPISLWRTGLYWTLVFAVAGIAAPGVDAQTKAKPSKAKNAKAGPKPSPAAATGDDPLTEWQLVHGAAIELREKIARQPRIEALRQQLAELAVRSAVGAEHALAIGDASLFDSYRRQFKGVPKDFAEARRWLGQAERAGIANARQMLDWMVKEKAAK